MKNNHSVQRTLKYLEKTTTMSAGIVERLLPRPGRGFPIRKDYLGFIDIIAVGDGRMLGIQCTTIKGIGPHRRKILNTEELQTDLFNWLSVAELEIWAWKKGAREPRIEPVALQLSLIENSGTS